MPFRPARATIRLPSDGAFHGDNGRLSIARSRAPQLVAWGGLIQRLSIATGLGWLTALFARARRHRASRDCQAALPVVTGRILSRP
jgi:hypothetical protein